MASSSSSDPYQLPSAIQIQQDLQVIDSALGAIAASTTASTTTATPTKGKGKKRAISEQGEDGQPETPATDGQGGEEGDDKKKKQKRPRQVLSCTTCVRRKTKCEKVVPCSACIKRGDPAGCHVEGNVELDGSDDPRRQPFATSTDLTALRHRVTTLEALVASILSVTPLPSSNNNNNGESSFPNALWDMTAALGLGNPNKSSKIMSMATKREEETVAAVLQRLREGGSSPTADEYTPPPFSLPSPSSLEQITSLLPSKHIAEILVDSFFKRVDWGIHVLHTSTFKEEFKEAYAKNGNGNGVEKGAGAKLATIFAVLALGLHFLPSTSSPFSSIETATLPFKWIDTAEQCLKFADWSGKPQLRSIQVILLKCFFWHSLGEIERVVVWIGAGVRIAQTLGLHTSDKTPVSLPNDSMTKLEGENLAFFYKELGSRVWWYLCSYDWDVSYRCRNTSVLRSSDFSTKPPLNLSDEEITQGPRLEHPKSYPTITTYEVLFADLVFKQQEWVSPRKDIGPQALIRVPTPEMVTALYHLVHSFSTHFPDYFRMEKEKEKEKAKAKGKGEQIMLWITLQRLALTKDIHCRFVRLHRRVMFNDPDTSPQVQASRKGIRTSASILLKVVEEMKEKTDFGAKVWWVNAYAILASAAILVSNMFLSSQTSSPPTDMDELREQVTSMLDTLRAETPLSPHSTQGLRVIELLLAQETVHCSSFALEASATFDVNKWKNVLDVVAKATMCTADVETNKLKALADDFSISMSGSGLDNVGNPKATLDPLLGSLSFANVASSDTSPSFPNGGTDIVVENTEEEYDEFFRTLGFLPPSPALNFNLGGNGGDFSGIQESADLFVSNYGTTEGMQQW